MRNLSILGVSVLLISAAACSGSKSGNGFGDDDGGAGSSGTLPDGGLLSGDGSTPGFRDGASHPPLPDGAVSTTTTIYAHTDDTLYTLDPSNPSAITMVGKFAGNTGSITDLAVNAAGDVYVNSELIVYKATVPTSPGTVNCTQVAKIAVGANQKFFALAFAPAGVLGTGEALIGGDGQGLLWSIDPATGATKQLGGFGPDPAKAGNVLALSGDIVFYTDGSGKPTGLATVRSCNSAGASCSKTSDYLVGIDMAALATAFTSGTPAASLLSGIYGGSVGNPGPGTHFGEVFGLGAWQGLVYGFTRGTNPQVIVIDTTTGAGTAKAGNFGFTNGWSGAGVTTKATITVPPPPPVR